MLCENKNVEFFGKIIQREHPESLASRKLILGHQYVKFKFNLTAFTLVLSTMRLREKPKNSASFSSIRQTYTPSQTQLMGTQYQFWEKVATPECLNYSVFPQNVKLVFLLLLVVAAEKKGWASNTEMFVIEVERRSTQP